MIKKIAPENIKTVTISEENPHCILDSECSCDSIYAYYNKNQRISISNGKNPKDFTFEFQEILPDTNENIGKVPKKIWISFTALIIVLTIFIAIFIALVIAILFPTMDNAFNFVLSFWLSISITSIIITLIQISVSYEFEKLDVSSALKNNFNALRMIINFIREKHRLPKNLDELKKSSHFSKSYYIIESINYDFLAKTLKMFFFSLIGLVISFLISIIAHISLELIICICLIIFLIGCAFVFSFHISIKKLDLDFSCDIPIIHEIIVLISNFIEYVVYTTKDIPDKNLVMAYLAGSFWFGLVHSEEFDLQAFYHFFDSVPFKITVHESDAKTEGS